MVDPSTKIVIIDDDTLYHEAVRAVADKLDGNVDLRCFSEAGAAMKEMADKPPDLLILDMRMPGMDGADVLEKLAADPNARFPVLLLTGARGLDQAHQLEKLNVTDVVTKPFEPGNLLDALKRALGHN